MAVSLYDASIEGSLIITAGTVVMVSVDFYEVNDQSFTISSATATLYKPSGAVVGSSTTDLTATLSTGIRSAKRASVTLQSTDTASLAKGAYYMIWTLTLGDSQTRKVKQAVQIRTVT